MMCRAHEKTRGADAGERSRTASKSRSVQGETETDSRWLVKKFREASAHGYIDLLVMVLKHLSFC